VLPADRSEVGKQRVRDNFAAAAQLIERPAEIHGVPERDRGGDEREPARTILLRLGCAITQSAEAMKANGAGEGVARFALVEFHGRLPPQSWQQDVWTDITRMRTILGVDPTTSLEDGIRKTIDWFKKEVAGDPALLKAAR